LGLVTDLDTINTFIDISLHDDRKIMVGVRIEVEVGVRVKVIVRVRVRIRVRSLNED